MQAVLKLPRALLAAVLFCVALCASAGAYADADVAVPPLKSHVTDLTGTLTAQQAAALDAKLTAFEQKKGSQLAVLLVATTEPETIEQYGIRVADQWKPGRKNVDDGAILLVAKNDRRLRIEVGRGLEGVLPDATARRIIDEIIAPYFKQGDFAGGIDAGAGQMMKLIDGEALPPPPEPAHAGASENNIGTAVVLLLVFSGVVRWVFGALLGGAIVGVAAGAVAVWMGAALLIACGVGFAGFIVTLVGVSTLGGGLGRIGGGGGSGGNWGGGGGGFGGGGASGRW